MSNEQKIARALQHLHAAFAELDTLHESTPPEPVRAGAEPVPSESDAQLLFWFYRAFGWDLTIGLPGDFDSLERDLERAGAPRGVVDRFLAAFVHLHTREYAGVDAAERF